jgi:hypothetical protein
MRPKIKELFIKYEARLILVAGLVLVAVISFEAGTLKGQKISQNPIIVEKPTQSQVCGSMDQKGVPEAQNKPQEGLGTAPDTKTSKENCAYVGSKNSNKYHKPTCQWAKRIKPENITCFSSEDEAKSKGYLPDKGCIK